jgi:hypothetical protein
MNDFGNLHHTICKTIFSRRYSQEQFPLLVANKLSSPKESVSKLPFLPQRHEDTKKKVLK